MATRHGAHPLHGTYVENKGAQTSASWLSGGFFQRQLVPKATPGFGQPRPISRLGRAGRPYLPCFPHRCAALVALAAKLVLPKGWAALLWRRLRRLCLPLLLPLRLALGAGGAPSTPG